MAAYVYILFNMRNGTLYTGVTNDLVRRVLEHKEHITKGFTQKYSIDKLGYYEIFDDMYNAIEREKKLKGSSRKAKLGLIEKDNKDWNDLYDEIIK